MRCSIRTQERKNARTQERKNARTQECKNARTLEGKKGLVIGIANDQSIAYGCAKAFKFLGAKDLAITYLNDKARAHVQPLAEEIDA